jgi:hypothetical protein
LSSTNRLEMRMKVKMEMASLILYWIEIGHNLRTSIPISISISISILIWIREINMSILMSSANSKDRIFAHYCPGFVFSLTESRRELNSFYRSVSAYESLSKSENTKSLICDFSI